MRHSMSKDTAFKGETTPRHTFLCSDSQCLPPGDPRILCAKHGSPITGKSYIAEQPLFYNVQLRRANRQITKHLTLAILLVILFQASNIA